MQRILLVIAMSLFPVAVSAIEAEIVDAVDHPARPEADVNDDSMRKPAEVLSFFGIKNGMKVLDVLAGGGYYTELLSYIVGNAGEVTFYNNPVYMKGLESIPGEPLKRRLGSNRLPNVKTLVAEINELSLPDNYYDAALFILGFHDIYYEDEKIGWHKVDEARFLTTLCNSIKQGGVLGIVDHVAAAGAPQSTGNSLHRIDPALIIEKLEARGLVFEAELDVLRNPDDDHSLSMVKVPRRTTDRVVYRFRKPD